jgi:centromere protein J
MNDLRSIVNKFKIELYRKELELNKSNNDDNNDNDDSDSNKEVEMLRKEYNKVKNKLDLINKNNEKNIIEMQKKIMIQSYENEKMKEKIDMYEQDNKIQNLEEELPKNSNKTLLNKTIIKEKKIKLVNDDDEDDNIIINNSNYTMNNIIKTSSKSNHINELDLEFPKKYFDENNENHKIIKHKFELDGKIIKIFNSGKKEIVFPNATKKEIFPDGYTLVSYSNGDIKETIPNYKEIYYYKKDEVNQIVFADGDKYIKYLKTGIVISDGNLVN